MDNTQLVLLAVAVAVALGAAWWWYRGRKDEAPAPTHTEQVMPPATRAVAAEPPLLSVPSFVRAESLGDEPEPDKSLFNTHVEREELGGGKFRDTIHIKKIAHRRNGTLRRIRPEWAQGDANFPHVALDADTLCYTAADGMRRLCPTGDPQRYFEIGAPRLYQGSKWQKVNLGQATRTANRISWQTANADLNIIHGGHFIKLEIPLKGGWQPPTGRVAFPVGLNGLTRDGGNLLADGRVVMRMQAPNVYDAANPFDVRDVGVTFPLVGGQRYALLTLPDLTGMASPIIDPTFTDQPDATDGLDTWLNTNQKTYNYGIATSMLVHYDPNWGGRGLLKFNLASLAGATVSSAVLTLYCSAVQAANSVGVGVHKALTQWYEGAKNGAAPDAGQDGSTYNLRNANGSVVWGTGAGTPNGLAGTDYTAIAAASTNIAGASASYNWTITDLVGEWVGGTAANYGLWVIKSDTSYWKQFASSDDATEGYRPKLVVEYTAAATGNSFIIRAPIASWCH